MTAKTIFDGTIFPAVIAAAFLFRNAPIIIGLTAFALIAFINN